MSEPEPGVIRPAYQPGQVVTHITDSDARGVIVAFMVRGRNHSYQVQWGVEKAEWHLDFEIVPVPEQRQIGFWQ